VTTAFWKCEKTPARFTLQVGLLFSLSPFTRLTHSCVHHTVSSFHSFMLYDMDSTSRSLVSQGADLYLRFISAPATAVRPELVRVWCAYEKAIAGYAASQSLDPRTASDLSAIVSNVKTLASARLKLDEDFEREIASMSADISALGITDPGERDHNSDANFPARTKRRLLHDDSDRCRTSKRSCRPTTTKYLPTPSPPPSTKSLKPSSTITPHTSTTANPAPDPVRQYFLTHLSSPYPTPTEKEKLCKKAKITRRKLESDLTNWRRRSDWTDIMNTYCGGDKGSMKTMISAIERGEERDEELLARFGRMKAYLEKRDEQAGEWVYQVCPEAP